MALQGNIDSFSVVDVLRLLGSSAKSGRLVVDGDRGSGSLWLADGLVSCGTTTRTGAAPVGAPPAEVLFDLLRFTDGAFVFEADVEPTELARTAAVEPVDVEVLLAESHDALAEWDAIVAVVPSVRSQVALALDLAHDTVELDRRTWAGVVAVAAGESAGAPATVGVVAALTGSSELPAMRLVRDLAELGVVEIGHELPEEPRFEPAFAHTPFDEPQEPAAFEPPVFEPASFAPVGFDSVPVAQPAYEAPPSAISFDAPAEAADEASFDAPFEESAFDAGFEPVAEVSTEVPEPDVEDRSPIGEVRSPEAFDVFAPFDPFGTAEPTTEFGGYAEVAEGASAFTDEPVEEAAVAEPADDADDEAQKAEFARQLAMLSPRAAEAVASADAGPSTEDEERARVARFLGSV